MEEDNYFLKALNIRISALSQILKLNPSYDILFSLTHQRIFILKLRKFFHKSVVKFETFLLLNRMLLTYLVWKFYIINAKSLLSFIESTGFV